ncbi:MAG: flagellar motor protein MotD [Gammaproteobacteria bacterium]|nr:MAG: flagellar motor protein MotD [Gammaproteobacteria bacterium]RLA23624.1 MAG: flagellar motor protein MotD [Gammaproteobacteria bacterium]
MARRKRFVDEPENHERWLISYADFITLLFAFFVVMYSVSSVNEGKYRILSDSLENAFSNPKKVIEPIQIGEIERTINPIESLIVNSDSGLDVEEEGVEGLDSELESEKLQKISENLEELLSPFIEKDLIEVKRHDLWVEVEMKSNLLFESGRAEVAEKAIPLLQKVSGKLRELPNPVHVEGFTDNIPIDTLEFPSNWELSAARAASIVHLFSQMGVSPSRMAAIGYGEHRPIADNRFEEGRNENRRVVLVIMSNSIARHKALPDERARLNESTPSLPGQGRKIFTGIR